MFKHGRKNYTDNIRRTVPNDDIHHAWKKYKNKYWGEVSSEVWEANDLAAKGDGEINALYTASNGVEIHIIRIADSEHAMMASGEDFTNGSADELLKAIEQTVRDRNERLERTQPRNSGRAPRITHEDIGSIGSITQEDLRDSISRMAQDMGVDTISESISRPRYATTTWAARSGVGRSRIQEQEAVEYVEVPVDVDNDYF